MTTIMEAIRNAQANFTTVGGSGANRHPVFVIAMSQLNNAIKALEQGKNIDDELIMDFSDWKGEEG